MQPSGRQWCVVLLLVGITITKSQGGSLIEYGINVNTPSVNGSSGSGHCTSVGVNLGGTSGYRCFRPNTSVLFDSEIPMLTDLSSTNMWASQLLTMSNTDPNSPATISLVHHWPGTTQIYYVEVVLFNCPQWGIGVEAVTLSFIVNNQPKEVRESLRDLFSCDTLVRACIVCTSPLCHLLRDNTPLHLQFHSAVGAAWAHVAEVKVHTNSSYTACSAGRLSPDIPRPVFQRAFTDAFVETDDSSPATIIGPVASIVIIVCCGAIVFAFWKAFLNMIRRKKSQNTNPDNKKRRHSECPPRKGDENNSSSPKRRASFFNFSNHGKQQPDEKNEKKKMQHKRKQSASSANISEEKCNSSTAPPSKKGKEGTSSEQRWKIGFRKKSISSADISEEKCNSSINITAPPIKKGKEGTSSEQRNKGWKIGFRKKSISSADISEESKDFKGEKCNSKRRHSECPPCKGDASPKRRGSFYDSSYRGMHQPDEKNEKKQMQRKRKQSISSATISEESKDFKGKKCDSSINITAPPSKKGKEDTPSEQHNKGMEIGSRKKSISSVDIAEESKDFKGEKCDSSINITAPPSKKGKEDTPSEQHNKDREIGSGKNSISSVDIAEESKDFKGEKCDSSINITAPPSKKGKEGTSSEQHNKGREIGSRKILDISEQNDYYERDRSLFSVDLTNSSDCSENENIQVQVDESGPSTNTANQLPEQGNSNFSSHTTDKKEPKDVAADEPGTIDLQPLDASD